jgi:hypothetical protein
VLVVAVAQSVEMMLKMLAGLFMKTNELTLCTQGYKMKSCPMLIANYVKKSFM